MEKSKKIAGVSVNTEFPPSKEDLIKSALQSKDYYRTPKQDALKDINAKIKQSGLYNIVPTGTKKSKQR